MGAALLGGCAQSPAPQGSVSNEAPPIIAQKAVGASTMAEPRDVKSASLTANPVLVPFEKLSIKLDEDARKLIAQLADRAKSSSRLTITGFCDRRQVGNARDAAIARAAAVRDELAKAGLSIKKVQIKYVTEIGDKHAAEVQFHGG
ncbi:OmpA family protein [Noviherbaspirillum humi]|nr:OmpA family protein [Noviherbaspirillum humi]